MQDPCTDWFQELSGSRSYQRGQTFDVKDVFEIMAKKDMTTLADEHADASLF